MSPSPWSALMADLVEAIAGIREGMATLCGRVDTLSTEVSRLASLIAQQSAILSRIEAQIAIDSQSRAQLRSGLLGTVQGVVQSRAVQLLAASIAAGLLARYGFPLPIPGGTP